MEQGVTLNVILLALCSGLAGTIIGLAGGYWAQKRLSDRERRIRISQWCFSQVLLLCHFIAAVSVTKDFFEVLAREYIAELSSDLEKQDKDFEISHAICVRLEQQIKKSIEDNPDINKKFRPTAKLMKNLIEKALQPKIDSDVLPYLPQDALIELSTVNDYVSSLISSTAVWVEFLESNDSELIDAHQLHHQWRLIDKSIKSAVKLTHILIREGKIAKARVNEIYSQKYNLWRDDYIWASFEDLIKLRKALKYVESQDVKPLIE